MVKNGGDHVVIVSSQCSQKQAKLCDIDTVRG